MSENPADIFASIVKEKAAAWGLELADDFEERIAKWREYLSGPVECGPRDPREPLIRHVWRVVPPE